MKITRHTTIEQYEAWLETNPPLKQIRIALNKILDFADEHVSSACKNLGVLKRVVKKISCLWTKLLGVEKTFKPGEIREPSTSAIQPIRSTYPANWGGIDHYRRMQMLARVEEEIAMEQIHSEALQILSN